MKNNLRRSTVAAALLSSVAIVAAETAPMKVTKATGPFDVKMTPQSAADAPVGRFTLEKQYHGDLEGSGTGEMLTGMTAVPGSAGYVAIEKITGTLAGRRGTFHLQHSGTMNRGKPSLLITVIPDSGTGELAGLAGNMDIQIARDGSHSYAFNYALPEAK
jgi:hypothetical protein